MKDCIINIYVVLKSLLYLLGRVVRLGFHLSKPKKTFAEYIRGEASILQIVRG